MPLGTGTDSPQEQERLPGSSVVFGVAAGYEDFNDHEALRYDQLFKQR
ncbi:hypothetical protein HALO59_170109 [Halomonas sp. 59]|nr:MULTISPECIES: hypothetical protein [Halomonas]CAD5248712.1 hypothetical protein HALO156_10282 [Halomonas sp. 156]CAD5264843.1 hypothetical protein HALO113_160946 [Halomonas sp. 113]CAD5267172.1 hypothetical protein HALO59_170109 [Halomonas sp. 59]CAD5279509.1 hypothetical protein HALOI3_210290 [Halomonas sp. I3]VXB59603.1 hypothetical protein HALO98_170291 [Halomonas titanicae]